MRVLGVFAGQGYQGDDLFTFFNNDSNAQITLNRYLSASQILENNNSILVDPFFTQRMIGCYQLALFHCVQPLLVNHDITLAGYSLGEVSAMLASSGATPEQTSQILSYRTQLMASLLHQDPPVAYDLLSVQGVLNNETINSLSTKNHCYVAIINSDQQWVVGGSVVNLQTLKEQLAQKGVTHTKLLKVHLPSHTPFYKNQHGQLQHQLMASLINSLRYPILSPIKLGKVYDFNEEAALLDEALYTPLQWQKVCEMINEYQYELIIDFGPGDAMTHFLHNAASTVITAFAFKKVSGFLNAIQRSL